MQTGETSSLVVADVCIEKLGQFSEAILGSRNLYLFIKVHNRFAIAWHMILAFSILLHWLMPWKRMFW